MQSLELLWRRESYLSSEPWLEPEPEPGLPALVEGDFKHRRWGNALLMCLGTIMTAPACKMLHLPSVIIGSEAMGSPSYDATCSTRSCGTVSPALQLLKHAGAALDIVGVTVWHLTSQGHFGKNGY